MRFSSIIATSLATLLSSSVVLSWSPSVSFSTMRKVSFASQSRQIQSKLSMALDYNDPQVAEEFTKVQTLTLEECEEEITGNGIPVPPTMNDMDVRLMLVELRMQLSGSSAVKEDVETIPDSFSSKFEEALYTKPGFKELYNLMKENGDHNSMNVASEYLNDPELARKRYGETYKSTLQMIDVALKQEKPVKTPNVAFSGFPANMGEMGCKMTLEALGEVVDFECEESDDFPILTGKVSFADIETAKAAIKQYNGMDMGMGTKLEMKSIE